MQFNHFQRKSPDCVSGLSFFLVVLNLVEGKWFPDPIFGQARCCRAVRDVSTRIPDNLNAVVYPSSFLPSAGLDKSPPLNEKKKFLVIFLHFDEHTRPVFRLESKEHSASLRGEYCLSQYHGCRGRQIIGSASMLWTGTSGCPSEVYGV